MKWHKCKMWHTKLSNNCFGQQKLQLIVIKKNPTIDLNKPVFCWFVCFAPFYIKFAMSKGSL